MKILFLQWDAFMQKGMENALKRLGKRRDIQYETFFYRFKDWDCDQTFSRIFDAKLASERYDAVLMVNFSPVVSDICEKYGIPCLSWVYDCPLHIRRTESLFNGCNRIFFFDRMQAETYAKMGVKGAGHLVLAADTDIYDGITLSDADRLRYGCDISLVGKLYRSDFAYLCAPLPQYWRGYLEGLVSSQLQIYGGYILGEMIDGDLMDELNAIYRQAAGNERPVLKEELEFAMNCEITGRERFMAAALLSGRHRVNVFTDETDDRLPDVHFGGYLDYYTQMPKAFKASKINLNISLKAIQTGIPLRVFDVLACGGFLLTNRQREIEENFTDGEELVIYSDIPDLVEKAAYYLAHEDERLAIARAGYKKVKEMFTFDRQLEKILEEWSLL